MSTAQTREAIIEALGIQGSSQAIENKTDGDELPNQKLGKLKNFQKLPLELRLKIWRLAMPGPRFWRIYMQKQELCPHIVWELKCADISPATLFVCQESRRETLRHLDAVHCSPLSGPPIRYINPSLDVLVHPSLANEPSLDSTELQFVLGYIHKIEKLAIMIDPHMDILYSSNLVDDFPWVKGLKEVLLVEPRIDYYFPEIVWYEDVNQIEWSAYMGTHGVFAVDYVEYRMQGFIDMKDYYPEWQAPKIRTGYFIYGDPSKPEN